MSKVLFSNTYKNIVQNNKNFFNLPYSLLEIASPKQQLVEGCEAANEVLDLSDRNPIEQ